MPSYIRQNDLLPRKRWSFIYGTCYSVFEVGLKMTAHGPVRYLGLHYQGHRLWEDCATLFVRVEHMYQDICGQNEGLVGFCVFAWRQPPLFYPPYHAEDEAYRNYWRGNWQYASRSHEPDKGANVFTSSLWLYGNPRRMLGQWHCRDPKRCGGIS